MYVSGHEKKINRGAKENGKLRVGGTEVKSKANQKGKGKQKKEKVKKGKRKPTGER